MRQRESILDPRYSILRPSVTREITADAYIYKESHDITLDLTSPVQNLIILLESALADPNRTKEFRAFIAELQCQYTDIIKTTSRFSRNVDHNLKHLDASRNMQESMRVWVPSALASIFPPLSAATGLLSMQTRFIDMHISLYDFCGVFVSIGTVLIVFVWTAPRLRLRVSARKVSDVDTSLEIPNQNETPRGRLYRIYRGQCMGPHTSLVSDRCDQRCPPGRKGVGIRNCISCRGYLRCLGFSRPLQFPLITSTTPRSRPLFEFMLPFNSIKYTHYT